MRTVFALLASMLACALFAAPALAQRDRVFVASYGSDSNPCTFGSPCKTFQQAVDVVAAGGEVTAIDSAGFGPVNITKSVTITSPNGVEAGIATPPDHVAINITVGTSDTVNLNGLTLDGVGGSLIGVAFNAGGSLNIQDSVIRNFAGNGISFDSTEQSRLSILNTLVSKNGANGIQISPSGSGTLIGVLSRVTTENNTFGGVAASSSGPTTSITISDCVSAENTGDGIGADDEGGTTNFMVRNSTIANNGTGLEADFAGATVWFTRTTVSGNGTGWLAFSGGVVSTFGDNDIVNNGSANNTPTSISHE